MIRDLYSLDKKVEKDEILRIGDIRAYFNFSKTYAVFYILSNTKQCQIQSHTSVFRG